MVWKTKTKIFTLDVIMRYLWESDSFIDYII